MVSACVQVTKLKLKQKQAEGIAEARSGQRGPVSWSMKHVVMSVLQAMGMPMQHTHVALACKYACGIGRPLDAAGRQGHTTITLCAAACKQ